MPLERSHGLRHGAPPRPHCTLWGVAHGGGTTSPPELARFLEPQGIVGYSSLHGGGAGYGGLGQLGWIKSEVVILAV